MEITTVAVEISGITPIMQNRFPNPKETLSRKGKKADNRTDWEIAVDGLHFTENDEVYIPAEALEKMIHSGGKRIIRKGRVTWLKGLQSGIIVAPDKPFLCNGQVITKKNLKDKMIVDGRKAINRQMGSGTAVWSIRPRFNEWNCTFNVKIIDPEIPLSILEDSLKLAGMFDGIGAFRTNPRFGRYEITSFKPEEK